MFQTKLKRFSKNLHNNNTDYLLLSYCLATLWNVHPIYDQDTGDFFGTIFFFFFFAQFCTHFKHACTLVSSFSTRVTTKEFNSVTLSFTCCDQR